MIANSVLLNWANMLGVPPRDGETEKQLRERILCQYRAQCEKISERARGRHCL